MKEFEKFWNNYWLSYSSYVGSEQRLAKATWKAALRWAKAMHDVSNTPKFSVNIREELDG